MKPLIGITCNFYLGGEPGIVTGYGLKEQKWHMIADEYPRAIERAGGIPVLIPILEDWDAVKELADKLDGVLISGGNDVDPTLYGETIIKEVGDIVPQRDRQDIRLTRYIVGETQKPFLGICRGIQILNVAFGGTLIQDMVKEDLPNHSVSCTPINHPVHSVSVAEGSLLKTLVGQAQLKVNSYHHQAVRKVADGLAVTAMAEENIVEGLELPGEQMVLAVQWHPEMMYDDPIQQRLLRGFVEACS